jgi:hypothetical protein
VVEYLPSKYKGLSANPSTTKKKQAREGGLREIKTGRKEGKKEGRKERRKEGREERKKKERKKERC